MYMHILEWNDFISGKSVNSPVSLTIGVFDGVHRGHQLLIKEICALSNFPLIITFKQNPHQIMRSDNFSGNIYSLQRKLDIFSALGVKITILIDFSGEFSKLKGRDFIDLLLRSCRIEQLVLGRNFRCGYNLDTGIEELAESNINIRTIDPVMEGDSPVSSSRIRGAICAGNFAEAALLLGRNAEIDLEGFPVSRSPEGKYVIFDARNSCRILPPDGSYRVTAYSGITDPVKISDRGSLNKISITPGNKMIISIKSGIIIVPVSDNNTFNPVRFEFVV